MYYREHLCPECCSKLWKQDFKAHKIVCHYCGWTMEGTVDDFEDEHEDFCNRFIYVDDTPSVCKQCGNYDDAYPGCKDYCNIMGDP